MLNSLSVFILTYNEELNLPQALKSLKDWVPDIFIVDSGSTDRTIEIAEAYGAKVYHHPWTTLANQVNWALQNLPITTDWVFRLDADEWLPDELKRELEDILPKSPPDITGYFVRYQFIFLDKWVKHGGYANNWLLRIFRNGKCFCEEALMDERHILTEGRAGYLRSRFIHQDQHDLSFWLIKHDRYATGHMRMYLDRQLSQDQLQASFWGDAAQRKRWLRDRVFNEMPLFFRVIPYFIYRYVFQLGFLDGRAGLIYHVLHGFWLRFYIDAKIYEAKLHAKSPKNN